MWLWDMGKVTRLVCRAEPGSQPGSLAPNPLKFLVCNGSMLDHAYPWSSDHLRVGIRVGFRGDVSLTLGSEWSGVRQ